MRTQTQADVRRLVSGAFKARVEVRDTGGTWRDLSTLPTFNAIKSVTWREDVDSPGLSAVVTFYRNVDAISLSPLHATSPINRTVPFDAGGSFDALVNLNRRLRISWVLVADEVEVPSAWQVAFDGLISRYELTDEETITVDCRGQHAELQDRFFEEEFVFAFGGSLQAGPWRLWQPNTSYALNEKVIPTDGKRNGKFYTVSTAGTSGATEPTWPGAGTVASGTAVFTYSAVTSPTGGYPVQQVMAEMGLAAVPASTAVFGDLGTSTLAVYTPVSPGWAINVFQVPRENVWGELQNLAQQVGWDLRWKWSNADSQFRLTLYDPNRAKTTPDNTFTFDTVRSYESLGSAVDNIRNAVGVVYSDAADLDTANRPKRKKLTRTDATSITAFGRRYMEVGEGSASNIDSTTEAQVMADAILSDLALPVADLSVSMRFFPWVELTDLYGFPADGRRFTSQQNLAVSGYSHTIEGGDFSTRLDVRGKPATGNVRWAGVATTTNPFDNHRLQNLGVTVAPSVTVTATPRGSSVQLDETPIIRALPRNLEFHVSQSSGFSPSASTLKGAGQAGELTFTGLKPGRTHYAKTVPFSWNAQRLVRGEPSEETSFVAGYVEPVDLNPLTVAQPLPPNGDFEGWFEGASVEPDHWTQAVGVWATDTRRTTSAGSGAYALDFPNTGSATRAELRSAWFPVAAGRSYVLDHLLINGAADGNVRLTVEWGDSAKASLGTATRITPLTGLTSWARSRQLVAESPTGARFARVLIGRDASGTFDFKVDAVSMRLTGEALVGVAGGFSDGNWSDYGGGFTGVSYWRDAIGLIHVRGLALTAVARGVGVTIFTLPLGFRPAAQEIFAQQGPAGLVRVDVAANGNVVLQTALNAADWVSFAGVIFDTR